MSREGLQEGKVPGSSWVTIPNGTKVKHRQGGYEGTVDGLTAIVAPKATLNPDGRTQYRINVKGQPRRILAPEEDLLILVDPEGVVLMEKAKVEYRRFLTQKLRGSFTEDRFTR